jgi:hypothetical protein
MTFNSWKIRIALATSLAVMALGTAGAQQMFTDGGPTFDPYAVYQQPSGEIIPGPVLPPTSPPVVIEQPLPVIPAGYPVRFVVFGEYLYMRGSDAAMTSYAVPVNNLVPPPVPPLPMGPIATIEHDFRSGFRAGFDWVWNDYSRWVATYTQLDLKETDGISVDPMTPLTIQSLVFHPATISANTTFLDAAASGRLRMRLADVEYRRVFVEDWYRWDFMAGPRYGHLEQDFNAIFSDGIAAHTVDVQTKFDGGGIRFGTRGDWRSANHGFFLYAQATTSFLAGRFSSQYVHNINDLTIANTARKDDRIINVTDVELGLGWHSRSHRWWFSGGYMFSTWDDIVNSAGLIRAVQTNSSYPIRERLTFDGLAARAELRF